MKVKRKTAGFTIVEVLVTIAIVAVVGTMLTGIFTFTLRGSGKSQILSNIKQNGQAVLGMMDESVRDADNVVCPLIVPPDETVSSETLVIEKKGSYTRFRFILPSLTTNGVIKSDHPVKGASQTPDQFISAVCLADDLKTNEKILTDDNPVTGISVENGSFIRSIKEGYKDQITIIFDLKAGVGNSPALTQIDPVTFQTSVQLR